MAVALITGVNGFTGQFLEKILNESGYITVGIGQTKQSNSKNYFQVDLTNKQALRSVIENVKPEVIFHLAGISFVGHQNLNDFYLTHLIGTRNLLEAIFEIKPDVKSILISSSANVYGNQTEGRFSETDILNPANDYAVSKVAMEMMVKLWFDKLPVFITRPFNYTGVGQSPNFLIPKIVSHFKEQRTFIELGNIDVWREFNDVRDVAYAYLKLAELCPVGEVVNICSGVVYSLREVIGMAEKITGHSIQIKVNPAFVRKNEIKSLSGDPEKLKRMVPKLRSYFLEETLGWMLEN